MNREAETTAADPSRAGAETGGLAAQFDAWLALTGQSPAPAGLVRLPMLTGSMHPAAPRGSILEIDPRDPQGFAPGEVVVLALDGRLMAHRALLRLRWRGQVRLLEMGDANPRGAWRPAALVVGRVVGVVSPAGAPLPAPTSRTRALRGLLRHLRGLLTAPAPGNTPLPEGKPTDDD